MATKRKRDTTIRKIQKGVEEPKLHPLGTSLINLPCDIIADILLKLPLESILICKNVCKNLRSIISDKHFARLHFERVPIVALVRTRNSRYVSRNLHLLDFDETQSVSLSIDYPRPDNHTKLNFKLPLRDSKVVIDTMLEARMRGKDKTSISCRPREDKFDVVNSCNGLLCLCTPANFRYLGKYSRYVVSPMALVVCNPITGEFIRLPHLDNDRPIGHNNINCGLGYLKNTNEFKVVRIWVHSVTWGVVEVQTLGTRLWRHVEYHDPFWWKLTSPTCLNGSLHWLVYRSKISLLSFDLERETLNLFSCPSPISNLGNSDAQWRVGFGELKGSLYISYPYANGLTFWTMKTYSDDQSWTEVLRFNIEDFNCWPRLYQPTVVFGGPGILICGPSRSFIYYDPQKHLFKFLEARGTSFELEPIFHNSSLVKLRNVVRGNDIEVLNVHSRCATFKLREEKEVLHLAKFMDDLKDSRMDI